MTHLSLGLVGSTHKRIGKTALALAFIHDTYSEDNSYEIEPVYKKSMKCSGSAAQSNMCELTIHDTQDVNEANDVFLIVFSIYVQASFSAVDETVAQIMKAKQWSPQAENGTSNKKHSIVLVAHDYWSQDDEYKDREVTQSEIQKLAEKWNIHWIQVNSKTGENVAQCLELVIENSKELINSSTSPKSQQDKNGRFKKKFSSIFKIMHKPK